MDNTIQKQFFETFEIKPKELIFKTMNCACGCHDCKNCDKYKNTYSDTYPQISDHMLLELLVIMTRYTDIIEGFDSVQELKEFVLKDLMYSLTQPECNIVKHQVRTLFEEGLE